MVINLFFIVVLFSIVFGQETTSMMHHHDNGTSEMEGCYSDPSAMMCMDFKMEDSKIEDDISSLCKQMPFMIGCSIKQACINMNVTGATNDECEPMIILATLCKDMPNMAGCQSYTSLCTENSVVKACTDYPSIANLPNTEEITGFILDMCTSQEITMCNDCEDTKDETKQWFNCDNLGLWTGMCQMMPEMSSCANEYKALCESFTDFMFCNKDLDTGSHILNTATDHHHHDTNMHGTDHTDHSDHDHHNHDSSSSQISKILASSLALFGYLAL